ESLENVYKVTLKAMEKTLGFEYASILMVQGKMLRLVSQRGYSKQLSLNLLLDGEKGVTVKAAKTGKSIFAPDIRKEKAYILGKPKMLSELAVPIKVEKEVLGVLNVESKNLAAFDEEDKRLLELLASHAAIAISDINRHTQLRKITSRLANLMKSSTEIMRMKNTHQRLRVIAKAIRKFGWRRIVISLRDENLKGTAIVTAGLTKVEIKILLERKAPGHVWRERLGPKFERFKINEFYYLPWSDPWIREYIHGVPPEVSPEEATTYAGVPSRLSLEEMVDWHPQDMLYAPLRTPEGRIVGILSMDDPVDGRTPTRESLAPLELFLHQAAMVIENAQLIKSLNEARKQLESYAEQLEEKVEKRTREL
ncbi:GAF domain-containing protein, partial [Candidatus Bathyarchaeota archaeon]|nr:GAF domain-containing protein [Candidatus Bathyarchaeota archaeon]